MAFAWSDGVHSAKSTSQSANVYPQLRRSRADTMPSSASGLPFNPYPTLVGRHRSGSMTLPSGNDPSAFASSLFSTSDPSSPLDENASSTIASTLASLGLNDDDDEDNDNQTSSHTPLVYNRNRSYTVGSLNPNDNHPVSLVDTPFPTLGLSTHSTSIQHRPRAISLGMADNPLTSEQYYRLDVSAMHRLSPPSDLRRPQPGSSLHTTTNSGQSHEKPVDSMVSVDYMPVTSSALLSSTAIEPMSPSNAPEPTPSRALWLGNVNASVSVSDLIQLFSCYGHVESARILSDKECAFVNFATVESAIAAKRDLEQRLNCMVAGSAVRVGFGRADVGQAMALTNEAGPNAQGPTRALWVGNLPTTDSSVLRKLFQAFGPIESVRILSHKNCGFVNFEHQEDAVRARKMLQNKEAFGPGTGTIRIGFARAPSSSDTDDMGGLFSPHLPMTPDPYQSVPWSPMTVISPVVAQPTQMLPALVSERRVIMQQLGHQFSEDDEVLERGSPVLYQASIPNAPELGSGRQLDATFLRDVRKGLDSGQMSEDVEDIAKKCLADIVALSSDYVGNTIVQKLFEFCTESTKMTMLDKIGPFLASIGVHKNGTWAAQKIIDFARTEEEMSTICNYIAPYVPLLLLDQFGNYVVQCCLRMGPDRNQFIFDAIVNKFWDIAQGRFGSRAVRAILENSIVTTSQKIHVASAVVQNAAMLCTNSNGVLLLNWYLDTLGQPHRYQVLYPRLIPFADRFCTQKLGSLIIFKMIEQQQETDVRQLLLNVIFNDPKLLDEIVQDQAHGLVLIQKIFGLEDLSTRAVCGEKVRDSVVRRKLQHVPAYSKILVHLDPHMATNEALDGNPSDNDTNWVPISSNGATTTNMYPAPVISVTLDPSFKKDNDAATQADQTPFMSTT